MADPARTLSDADLDAIAERVVAKLGSKVPTAKPERERPPAASPISVDQRRRIEKRLARAGLR